MESEPFQQLHTILAKNGLTERSVKTFKDGMKELKEDSLESRDSGFLSQHHITPYDIKKSSHH